MFSAQLTIRGKNFGMKQGLLQPALLVLSPLFFLGQGHAGYCCEISLYVTTSFLPLSERDHHSPALQVSVHGTTLSAQPRRHQHLYNHSLDPQAASESCWVAQTSGTRHLPQLRSTGLQPASRVACAGGCT